MKRLMFFAVLMSVCSVCSLCWGASGTQTTTYSKWPAVTDITSYLGTSNAWKAMPTKAIIGVSYGMDGRVLVLDGSGCVSLYDPRARTYTTQGTLGCGWSEISSEIAPTNTIILHLLKVDAGCTNGTKRWYRSTNNAAPVVAGCADHVYGGDAGTLLWVNVNGTGSTYYYDGAGYTDMHTGFFNGGAGSAGDACLLRWDSVTAGHVTNVYVLSAAPRPATAPLLLGYQPPQFIAKGFTGGFTGCTINDDVILVTDGTKSYMYDRKASPPATTWQLVSGSVTGLTSTSKGEMFGVVSGNLAHLNVYAGYISATLQSTWTGCPDDLHTCPVTGVTHTRTVAIHFPHGIGGATATFAGVPGATNQITSWDASPSCDLVFGDPSDPECFATVAADVHCSVVNASIYSPPPTPTCHAGQKCQVFSDSMDARAFTGPGFSSITASGEDIVNGVIYASAFAKCEAATNACSPNTYAVCPAETGVPPGQKAFFTENATCTESAPFTHCGKTLMEDRAQNQCRLYSRTYGVVEFWAKYTLDNNGIEHCIPTVVRKKEAIANEPCF